jgi:hypothetical protein
MTTKIDMVSAQAAMAALEVIEAYFTEADERRECARRVEQVIRSQVLARIDEQDFGSRPKW